MKFTLEIEMGNDAMQSYKHLRTALKYVAFAMAIRNGPHLLGSNRDGQFPRPGEGASVLDLNGNTVGHWAITEIQSGETPRRQTTGGK